MNQQLLQNAITEYNDELNRYNVKQTKISGTRIRGLLMQINKLTKETRKEILEAQKLVPKKPRTKKHPVNEVQEVVQEVVQEEVVAPIAKVAKAKKVKKI